MTEAQLQFFDLQFQRLFTEVKHQAFATDVFIDGLQYVETKIRMAKERVVRDYGMARLRDSGSHRTVVGEISAKGSCAICQGKGGMWEGEEHNGKVWVPCTVCNGSG